MTNNESESEIDRVMKKFVEWNSVRGKNNKGMLIFPTKQ